VGSVEGVVGGDGDGPSVLVLVGVADLAELLTSALKRPTITVLTMGGGLRM